MHRIRFKIVVFFLLSDIIALSQSPYAFENFIKLNVRNGLIDNEVHYLAQDSLGYIWAATENGVSRYNGKTFTSFTHVSDSSLLHGNYIERLKMLDAKNLIILAREGCSMLNTVKMKAVHYDFEPTLQFEFKNSAYDALKLKDGSMVITTQTGFFHYNNNGKLAFEYHHFDQVDVATERIHFGQEIIKLSESQVLFYAQGWKMYHYDLLAKKMQQVFPKSDHKWVKCLPWENTLTIKYRLNSVYLLLLSFAQKKYRLINLISGEAVEKILPDRLEHEFFWNSYITELQTNHFAINCVNNGFFTFDFNPKTLEITFSEEKYLPERRCYHLYQDQDQRLWIATNKGILMEKDSPSLFKVFPIHSQNEKANSFLSCIERVGDSLYLGTFNRIDGMILYDVKKEKIVNRNFFSDAAKNEINHICLIRENTLFVNTGGGRYLYHIKTGTTDWLKDNLPLDVIFPINSIPGHIHSYSVYGRKLFKYKIEENKFYEYPDVIGCHVGKPEKMYYDQAGTLWISGTELSSLSNEDLFEKHPAVQHFITNSRILGLHRDNKDNLWLGTSQGELIKYDLKKRKAAICWQDRYYKMPIGTILSTENDFLYFSVGDKMCRYDVSTQTVVNLSNSLEFPEEKVFAKNVIWSDDCIYAPTVNHLVKINTSVPAVKKTVPFISSILKNNFPVIYHPDEYFDMGYNKEYVELEICDINYSSFPSGLEYKLDNDAWRESDGKITFHNLSFGVHTLQLRSSGLLSGVVSKTYTINLIPPFYKRIWFYVLFILCASSLIFYEIRRRIMVHTNLLKLNEKLADSEMKALHSQMNPHFTFNSLNSIKFLILNGQEQKASRYLSIFATLIRHNLNYTRSSFITIQDEIEYLKKYVDMEGLRFPNLKVDFLIDKVYDTGNVKIPQMILQPIVENAIKYSASSNNEEMVIKVSIISNEDYITTMVEDFGAGIYCDRDRTGMESGNHISIDNINQRIVLYNQKFCIEGTINFRDKTLEGKGGRGTIVLFTYNAKNIL